MWMIKNYLIPAGMLAAFAMVASSAAYAQSTPDEQTPANEGVCDELIGGTPGLYGLCVGFCEAQDCEATLDESTDEVTFSSKCKPSSRRLLENYNKRAQPGDPTMPCVKGECPCWTEAEIEEVDGNNVECGETVNQTRIADLDPDNNNLPDKIAAVDRGRICFYQIKPAPPTIIETMPDEYLVCRDSIRAECEERGIPF